MLTTPVGDAYWAIVFDPREDNFDPEAPRAWSIAWVGSPNDKATMALMQQIEAEFARIHGDGAKPSKNAWPFRDQTDKEGTATGMLEFRFKKKERTKKGQVLQAPTVYDSKKNPWPSDTLIGNGSKVKIAFHVWGWEDKFGKKGVSLSLEAVQVLDLVPYEKLDPGSAFSEENGYVVDTPAAAFADDKEEALTPSQRLQRRAAQVRNEAPDLDDEEIPF